MFLYLVKFQHTTTVSQEPAAESIINTDILEFPPQLIGEWTESLYTLYVLEDGTVYWIAGPTLYRGSVSGNAFVFTERTNNPNLNKELTIEDITDLDYEDNSSVYKYTLYGNNGLSIVSTGGGNPFSFVRADD